MSGYKAYRSMERINGMGESVPKGIRDVMSQNIAEAPTMKEIEALEDGLEMDMMDPTSARIIFRNGHRLVLVKDISAAWITEE